MNVIYDSEEKIKQEIKESQKFVIFGASERSAEFISSMLEKKVDFVVDNRYAEISNFHGIPVRSPESLKELSDRDAVLVGTRSFIPILYQMEKLGFLGKAYSLYSMKVQKDYEKSISENNYIKEFTDRSNGSENLLMVVAGFQEYYWDIVLERVRENQLLFKEPLDVCVCIPQGNGITEPLKKICEKNGWSFLLIAENQLAKAQNIAIVLHEKARWIYKIDEDIILCRDYFSRMKSGYLNSGKALRHQVGFLAPVLNLNFCGTEVFLKTLGIEEKCVDEVGDFIYGNDRTFMSPEIGRWVWKNSVPFDRVAEKFEKLNFGKFDCCTTRFSVGAFLMPREFWVDIDGFVVAPEGQLGIEEEQMNARCINTVCVMAMDSSVLAGHLGFGWQKKAVYDFYNENRDKFKICW